MVVSMSPGGRPSCPEYFSENFSGEALTRGTGRAKALEQSNTKLGTPPEDSFSSLLVQAYGGGGGATSVDFDLKGQTWQWGDYGLDQVCHGRQGSHALTSCQPYTVASPWPSHDIKTLR